MKTYLAVMLIAIFVMVGSALHIGIDQATAKTAEPELLDRPTVDILSDAVVMRVSHQSLQTSLCYFWWRENVQGAGTVYPVKCPEEV